MTTPLPAGPLLSTIREPADIRALPMQQLLTLAEELREFITDNVSRYGGHFGASLGVIELTIALHRVFNTPEDQLVWDVGHQAYGHKILTGRRECFHTNRMLGGISGFPRREESPYDTFGVGHSSTSISAALGMSLAARQAGKNHRHVAVIGDGAMTAGLAFEGMNHMGSSKTDLLIILNDNCMSIDPNVGALKEYLTRLTTSPAYNKLREDFNLLLKRFNRFGQSAQELVHKMEHGMKHFFTGSSNLFEALNLRYFGPVDGHDLQGLVRYLEDLRDLPGPKLLHCLTVKGKGFLQAEEDQTKWHAPGIFDKITGCIQKKIPKKPQPPKYQDVFGHTIVELAEKNDKIMAITPAMPSGSSLNIMMKAMPTRALDVGIAEQHAVTLSAGMATQGAVVFCNIYSTFMQRAYDQLIHDVCVQNLAINFCLDRAGLAGADGATHHGAYDLAYLRCLPNVIIAAPMDEWELRDLMYSAQLPRDNQAVFIRYPRGQGIRPDWKKEMKAITWGQGRKLRKGQDIAILSIGHIGNQVTKACVQLEAEGIMAAHYDMRFVKPLDEALLHEVFKTHRYALCIEDACKTGGFGSAVAEFMVEHGYASKLVRLGIPDKIIEHGSQLELYALCGYDAAAICKEVYLLLGLKVETT